MENRIKQFITDNKAFVVFYLLWFLFNLVILVTRVEERLRGRNWSDYVGDFTDTWKITDKFWPLGSFEIAAYDKTEFIFYLIVPFVLLGIWKLINKDVKKYIKDYQSKQIKRKPQKQKKNITPRQEVPMKRYKKSGVISLLVISIITWFLIYSAVALMEMQDKSSLEMAKNGNFILFILRIATVITLTKKAKEFNEKKWGWGIFGFFLPVISQIVMLVKINKSNRAFKKFNLSKEKSENN